LSFFSAVFELDGDRISIVRKGYLDIVLTMPAGDVICELPSGSLEEILVCGVLVEAEG